MIAKLFTLLYGHGLCPNALLEATIVSIPKNKLASAHNSTNYRGIALISALAKISDLVIISKYRTLLVSSDLQFAYKERHSTILCHGVLKEIIHHYNDNNSDVYCCFLDASKAFDRVRYDKLFTILLERNLPPIIVRYIYNSYLNQKTRTTWDGHYSDYFNSKNGIKQGGVLSPVLYALYQDTLIHRLQQANYGCHLGNINYGVISYADDIALLSPTIHGLQCMMEKCQDYSKEYDVMYNETKSVTICFSKEKTMLSFSVKLNNKYLRCTPEVMHLGIKLSHNLQCINDIKARKHHFIGKTNHVLSIYKCMHALVKCKLIDSYCCSFYGAELWDFNSSCFLELLRSWNIAIRHAWGLPYNAHSRLLAGLAGFNLADRIFNRFHNFYRKIEYIDNKSISYIFKLSLLNKSSSFNKNIAFIHSFNKDKVLVNDDLHSVHSIIQLHNIMKNLMFLDIDFNENELYILYKHFATV
jgi:hypothetical protein